MKKLVNCKTCGESIAKSAKVCPHCGAKQKKGSPLGVFILIIGIILIFAGFNGALSGEKGEETNPPTISMKEFNSISTGMTYEEIVAIIGSEGEVLSEVDMGMGDEYKTTVYMWDGEGAVGANANITIQGGKVIAKAQVGLK